MQGSLAGFLAAEVAMLRPDCVVLGHHDDWLPPFTTEPDVEPIGPGSQTWRRAHSWSTWSTWRGRLLFG